MMSERRPPRAIILHRRFLILASLLGMGMGGQAGDSELLIVRTEVRISAQETYHQEYRYEDGFKSEETDETDSCSYTYTGEDRTTIVAGEWQSSGTCTYVVSGGGGRKRVRYSRYDPPVTEQSSWTYQTQPTGYDPNESGMVALWGAELENCWVAPDPVFPVDPITPGGYARLLAMSMPIYATPLFTPIDLPTNTASYTITHTFATNVTEPFTGLGQSGQTTASYVCVVTIQRNPADLEAVIIADPPPLTPLPRYADWIPAGGVDEKTPGSNFMIRVQVRQKGASEPASFAKAKFSFALNGTSREPGISLNHPPKDRAGTGPDLRFHPADAIKLADEEGQVGESVRDDLNELTLLVDSYDYGAYGQFTVTANVQGGPALKAHLEGDPKQESLPLPKDENHNFIADAWERSQRIYDRNLPPDWAADAHPAKQYCDGDGISLFEKYRGFRVSGAHERLKPDQKHLFVRDTQGWTRLATSENKDGHADFEVASGCRVRFISNDEWTGQGLTSAQKRIVNFNHGRGHVVDQHAVLLRYDNAESPLYPSDWMQVEVLTGGTLANIPIGLNVERMTLARLYPDGSTSVQSGQTSPKDTYHITVYMGNIGEWVNRVVRRHLINTRPEYGHLDPNQDPIGTARALEGAVQEFKTHHPGACDDLYWKTLCDVCAHELGHSVGLPDMKSEEGTPKSCLMWVFSPIHFELGPDDRFRLKPGLAWPTLFCHEGAYNDDGKGCWEHLKVTDEDK